ncbi:hypothetical protein J4212_02530 [Candidatus Woesearchaeota archaeon]|nr:hypothetical protein [Candidatus Woesearchaeota archaeon]
MKKIFFLIFIILIIITTQNVLAAYNVEYHCQNDICIEGDTVEFGVTLTSDSFYRDDITIDSLEYTQVSIKDKQYDIVIARKDESIKFSSYDTKKTTLSGIIPPPTKGHDLYFVPCFSITMIYHFYGSYTYDRYDKTESSTICGQDTLTMKVYPLSEIECRNTGNCKEDEHCLDFKCKKIICEDNQGYENHECKNLKCTFFQNAKNHRCEMNYLFVIIGSIILIIFGILIFFKINRRKRHKK